MTRKKAPTTRSSGAAQKAPTASKPKLKNPAAAEKPAAPPARTDGLTTWVRPSGTEIAINNNVESIEMAEKLGWKRLGG